MLRDILAGMRVVLLGLLTILGLGAVPALAQSDEIDIEVFYRELEPYGRWVDHPRYGEVWVPQVDEDWRPYTRGHWVHTEEHGWYWESDEPFGWAVYHYGRWFRDDDEGWAWVPGTEWGPAWVAWRHSDDEVGWAPLPPEAEWRDGGITYSETLFDAPRFSPAWCFVPVALLTAPSVWVHVVPPRRNAHYLGRTRFISWHRGPRPHFYNVGLDRRRWERLTGRRIESRRIIRVGRPFREASRGRDVRIYNPRIVALPRNDGRPGFRPPVWRERRPDRPFPGADRDNRHRHPGVRAPEHQFGDRHPLPHIERGGRPGRGDRPPPSPRLHDRPAVSPQPRFDRGDRSRQPEFRHQQAPGRGAPQLQAQPRPQSQPSPARPGSIGGRHGGGDGGNARAPGGGRRGGGGGDRNAQPNTN